MTVSRLRFPAGWLRGSTPSLRRGCVSATVVLCCALVAACSTAPETANEPGRRTFALDGVGEAEIAADLDLETLAAEPLVFDPVDLEVDERGRVFVLEMPGYPVVAEDQRPGRVVQLIDDDGDAVFDRRRVFAEGFRYADSILPHHGGLLVADPPDLVFVADTDGDAVADLRQVLLSGFAVGPSESNFNGLRHGLDNWIYGANGSSGGEVYFPDRPGEKTSIRGRDFRFRFEQALDGPSLGPGRFETSGRMGGGFGLELDDWGRRFVTHEQRHIQAVIFDDRFLHPGHDWPSTTVEISDHGRRDQTRIYPVAEQARRVNHPEQAGTFTAGSGLTFYGGDGLPERYRGSFLVCESVHHLVHRDVVEALGAGFVARRGEEASELLAGSDPLFRPVNLSLAPDGSLFLLDLQRAVIEHPEWIPDRLEAELDLREGNDRGRIYRLRTRGGRLPRPVFPASDGHLEAAFWLSRLGDRNKWWRDTAQRVLVQHPGQLDPEVRAELRRIARAGSSLARLHALWALEGRGLLEPSLVVAAMGAAEEGLRENALLLAERELDESDVVGAALMLANDAAPRVRLVALLVLAGAHGLDDGRLKELDDAILSELSSRDEDPWLRLAAVNAASRQPLPFLETLLDGGPDRDRAPDVSAAVLADLGRVVGERGVDDEVDRLVALALESHARWSETAPLVASLLSGAAAGIGSAVGLSQRRDQLPSRPPVAAATVEGLRGLAASPAIELEALRLASALGVDPKLPVTRIEQAAAVVLDRKEPTARRLRELEILSSLRASELVTVLLELLGFAEPPDLQRAAFEILRERSSDADDDRLARELVQRWRQLGPGVRERVGDHLVYRPAHHQALLDGIERGAVPIGELNLHLERRRALLRSPDPTIRRRAEALFDDLEVTTRRQAIEAMTPALELEGDPDRGSAVFAELCARCHREPGGSTTPSMPARPGPDLGDAARRSRYSLLYDIVDPNAAVAPEYVAFEVATHDGEVVLGLLVEAGAERIVLRTADGGDRTLLRSQVERVASSGMSLMPEGLEAGLEPAAMADLLAFLQRRPVRR